LARNRDDSLGRIVKANTLGFLARTLLLQGRCTEAEPLVREAVGIWKKERPDNYRYFYWVSLLGDVLCTQHKYAEAEPFLLQGYEGMKQREAILPANEKRRLAEAGERVVRFYEATSQPEETHLWREKVKPQP
jgi:hypothetical protein